MSRRKPPMTADERLVWVTAFVAECHREMRRRHEGCVQGSVDEISGYSCVETADFVLAKFREGMADESTKLTSEAYYSLKANRP